MKTPEKQRLSSNTIENQEIQDYSSIKKNYLYNTTINFFILAIPFITLPYVGRILGPEGFGTVTFANSIINYFIMLSVLGIPLYGMREIARVRDDPELLNKVFSELFFLNIIAMLVSLLLYLSLFFFVEKIQKEGLLFAIVGISLILSAFNIDWLYRGVEDFRFIAITRLVFSILSIFLIFSLVRTSNDYLSYAAIGVVGLNGTNFLNIINSRKFVKLKFSFKIFSHLKPILVIFLSTFAITIYVNLDKVLLGFISGEKYVGYYGAAILIDKTVVFMVTSLGVVLIPRISYLIRNPSSEQYNKVCRTSINFVYFLGFPSIIGVFFLAPEIILIFLGEKFNAAVSPLQIMAPIILIIGINNFLTVQILIPNKEEKKVLIAAVIGVITNLSLNLFLIPKYYHVGAAIATLITEFSVLVTEIALSRNHINLLFSKTCINYFVGSLLVFNIILVSKAIISEPLLLLAITIPLSVFIYFIFLFFLKDEFIRMIFNEISLKLLRFEARG